MWRSAGCGDLILSANESRILLMRRINVKVIARARQPRIISVAADSLKVYVTAPAVDGKANQAVIAAVAEYFQIKPRQLRIVSGAKSPHKIIELKHSS